MVGDMAIRIAIAIGVAWQGGGYCGGRENNFRDRYGLERTAASLAAPLLVGEPNLEIDQVV